MVTIVTDWGSRFEDIQLFLHLQKGPCSSNRHVSLPCESYPMWGYRNFIRIFAGNSNHVGAVPMSAGPIPWWLDPSITFPKTNSSPLKIDPWKKKKILLEASIFRDYVSFRECKAPADGWRLIPNTQCTEYLPTWQFFCALFRMVQWRL